MTRTTVAVALSIALAGAQSGCGPAADHTATLTRLREAITTPIRDETQMEDHNQLVENVVNAGALEGLRRYEVEERIGRGEECGVRELCSSRHFLPTDWFYDVGRNATDPQLPAGPTLLVGFDSTGIVDRAFYVTRR